MLWRRDVDDDDDDAGVDSAGGSACTSLNVIPFTFTPLLPWLQYYASLNVENVDMMPHPGGSKHFLCFPGK